MSETHCLKREQILRDLSARIKRVDEPRWISSRYAAPEQRDVLIVLYAFYYELARVRLAVSDPVMGQIRYQWWRETLERIDAGMPREHDISLCLAHYIDQGILRRDPLNDLIDASEQAFLTADRQAEPEAGLAQLAASILAPGVTWRPEWNALAPVWSALRRGERVSSVPAPILVPSAIRPALAHFRLRQIWHKQPSAHAPQPLKSRLSVLWAMLSGHC